MSRSRSITFACNAETKMEPPSRILFIVVSRIGDTLFSTPALRSVAHKWPNAKITVLGHPKRAEVFQNLPYVTELGIITKTSALVKGLWRQTKFDLAFVYGFDPSLVSYALSVSSRVVAFRQSDEALNARLAPAVPVPAFQSEHAVKQLLRLPQALGINTDQLRIDFSLSAEEVSASRTRLEQHGLANTGPLVGLQVASFPTKGYRDWPIERFLGLTERIADRWPAARFLIFGGKEERDRTSWLATAIGVRAVDFSGRLTLRETGALMGLIDLYVGVDTGPTHIMSSFDTPMVALYHCLSSSRHTGPLDHPAAWLIDHPDTDGHCSEKSAMDQISIGSVWAAVQEALAGYQER